jgi:ABC-type transporter MlaC component
VKRNPLASRILPSARTVACWLLAAIISLAPDMPRCWAGSGSGDQDQVAAENFVRANLETGLGILDDPGISDAERVAQLRAFFNSLIDVRRLALFSLGAGDRSATPTQINRFVGTFGNYVISYYDTMLLKYYSGQIARVTGSSKEGPNEYVVTVELVTINRKQQDDPGNQPIEMDFQLADDGGHFIVSDIAVAGVWLGQQERDRIYDYLLQTSGNIGGLIAQLTVSTERLQNAAGTGPATQQQADVESFP